MVDIHAKFILLTITAFKALQYQSIIVYGTKYPYIFNKT